MPKRVDFSNATPKEIADLTLNSALKHSLDNINGTSLGTFKYILMKTKQVKLWLHNDLIEATLAKAVIDNKLVIDDNGLYKWPNHQLHYRLRRERLERQRISARRTSVTNKPDSAQGTHGNSVSSDNSTEGLGRKRKRSRKNREASGNEVLSTGSVNPAQGYSLSTHSLTYNVNNEKSERKAEEVDAPGTSGAMQISNNDKKRERKAEEVDAPGTSGAMQISNNDKKRERKAEKVDAPGTSGAMQISNNDKKRERKAEEVDAPGTSGAMQISNNDKKKRAKKNKRSKTQNDEEGALPAKKTYG